MIQRRTLIGAIGAVALSSASYFPMTACAAMPRGEGSDPIRIVVPYPPGGPLDVSARTIAEAVVDTLGNVIVDNRPGAGGNIGTGQVVKSHAINPHLYKRLPYDAKKDFKAVTLIAHVPNVLVVTPEFSQKTGVKTVQNLVEYAKKNPGKLNYASGGNGSAGHMAGEWLKQIKDIDMVHVPFAGAAAAQLSVLAGQTDLIFDNLASATANIRRHDECARKGAARRPDDAGGGRPRLRHLHVVRPLRARLHARRRGRAPQQGDHGSPQVRARSGKA